ncbi:unnamed protein product [Oikopleura dioica]|uniref:Uncharacterized protein n=1 Tax=Oikopleura dioica TaxID=34765 RepID=E4YEZ8_OIKDI|nr:unnamed protein product [Oikopleura dioica]
MDLTYCQVDDFEPVSIGQTPRKPPRNFPSTENRRRSRSLSRSSFGSLVKESIKLVKKPFK